MVLLSYSSFWSVEAEKVVDLHWMTDVFSMMWEMETRILEVNSFLPSIIFVDDVEMFETVSLDC